jgi:ABC-type uncharacterized transport system permease subunit
MNFKKANKNVLGLAGMGLGLGVAGMIGQQVGGQVGTNVSQAVVQTSSFLPVIGTIAGGSLAIQQTQNLARIANQKRRKFP